MIPTNPIQSALPILQTNPALSGIESRPRPNNYVGKQVWRFGPCMSRPEVIPPEITTCQFYLGGNLNTNFRPLPRWRLQEHQRFFIHLPLNMNLATVARDQTRELQQMLDQIIDQPASCVLHTGTNGTIQTLATRLNSIQMPRSKLPCSLLLEPPAGEGNKLGANWDELRRMFEMLDRTSNIGLCLDTQHMFGAGMCGFSSTDEVEKMLEFACTIGRIGLIHLNDSEVPFRACRDKHAVIGSGHIWSRDQSSLKRLLEMCRDADVDLVSETGGFGHEHAFCSSLLTGSDSARRTC